MLLAAYILTRILNVEGIANDCVERYFTMRRQIVPLIIMPVGSLW